MRRRATLGGIAAVVLIADRLTKGAVAVGLSGTTRIDVVGDWVRLVHGENRGGLFGVLQGSAPLLALLSIGVIALLVAAHEREHATQPTILTLAIGALAGGALGNLVDRLQFGYVLDFIDIGVGAVRFWTFNVADAAITGGILLLLIDALQLRPFGSIKRQ